MSGQRGGLRLRATPLLASISRHRPSGRRVLWSALAGSILVLASLWLFAIARILVRDGATSDNLEFVPLSLPPRGSLRDPGPFVLEQAWQMKSAHRNFGGYSALLSRLGGRLLAINDRGHALEFVPGDPTPSAPIIQRTVPTRVLAQTTLDSEAATIDPATRQRWIAWENTNAITREDPGAAQPLVIRPPAMAAWSRQRGPEAMVRLSDGRFIVLREGFGSPDDMGVFGGTRHDALLFAEDPLAGARPIRFSFVGAAGFSPVDMGELPDGRVLILMRRLVWPFPAKFAGRIMLADPHCIIDHGEWRAVPVASFPPGLPTDNFEAMDIVPEVHGAVTVWLISDDNGSAMQRTLLWKLHLDPKALPLSSHQQCRENAR